SFKGLRKPVSVEELVKSKLLDSKTVEQLMQGLKSEEEVRRSIQNYLGGSTAIAGVYIEATKEKMSIYNALKKGFLRPGTSLVLLEAQAATGFIVDPINNLKLSVDEAVEQKVVGWDYKDKLLSAERAVTGYTDPYSKETISLFQAMKKELILKDHGIRLLEAQIATGGIIDPEASHRLPVEVAYSRGLFDEEMNQILSDPNDDTKGFFDPNTQENLTYLDLKNRCITEPETGLCLLPIKDKNSKTTLIVSSETVQTDSQESEMLDTFTKSTVTIKSGKFANRKMSILEIFETDLVDKERKEKLINDYKTGKISQEILLIMIIEIIETERMSEKMKNMKFKGLRKQVTLDELFKSKIVDMKTVQQLDDGEKTQDEVGSSILNYLEGSTAIAGLYIEATKEKMSIYNALKKGYLRPGTSLVLLEAQAATGFIVDPINNLKLSVDEAVEQKVVGWEYKDKLLSAERAVTGYTDPYSKETLSLFQAMKKELILKDHGIRLLEAQIATGGIIDPQASHRLPVEVAYSRGLFDEEMNQILADPSDDTKGFFDPNTEENLTYLDLKQRCITDPDTGLCLLSLKEKRTKFGNVSSEVEIWNKLQNKYIEISFGKFSGKKLSLKELFETDLIDEATKKQLLDDFRSGKISFEKLIITITEIIERQRQSQKGRSISFKGLRKPVSVEELVKSKLLDSKTVEQLMQGLKSEEEVRHSIQNYLGGSTAIAGVYIEATKEKMSIYNALKKGFLRPGTSLVLLEAQAATGFIVDPINNLKLSVDEAVEQKVVGWDYKDKLLSAERAVTGYTDPYSKETISLFQAMKKELILKDHGIRLLEAQIATGGIIDPQASHRLPVEVAYSRGLFDEEMNQILSDPNDDTKGFFDPNTQENLTYLDLKNRCITEPETGLCLLPNLKMEKSEVVSSGVPRIVQESEMLDTFTKSTVTIKSGKFANRKMSILEIFETDLVDKERKEKLINDYKTGKISQEILLIMIIEIIETERMSEKMKNMKFKGLRKQVTLDELFKSKIVDMKTVQQLDDGEKTQDEVGSSILNYLEGSTAIAGLYIEATKEKMSIYNALKKGYLRPGTSLVLLEAQAATGFIVDPINNLKLSVDEAVEQKVVGWEYKDKLLSAERAVTGYTDPYSKETLSLFQAMKKELILKDHGIRLLEAQIATGGIIDPQASHRLPVEVAYSRGLFDEEMNQILADPSDDTKGFFDPNTEENLTYLDLKQRCITDPDTGLCLLSLKEKRTKFGNGLRKPVSVEELVKSKLLDSKTVEQLMQGLKSEEEVRRSIQNYLGGSTAIAGVYIEATKEKMSIYNALKKGFLRPGTSLVLLEAQAATGFIVDPINNLKLSVDEAVEQKVVGWDYKDKLLSAERAVTGYNDPYSKETISLFQAMKKGLILKDHGIRLLEAQIATGGIIDPEASHRLPVEVAYSRGLFDEEMNQILTDPSDDTKGFFDPNTEENLTYLDLKRRCITDPDTGLCLLPIKEFNGVNPKDSKTSKKRKIIIDPDVGKEMSVYEAYQKGLLGKELYLKLSADECAWEESKVTLPDGTTYSTLVDKKSGKCYDVSKALAEDKIKGELVERYNSGAISIFEFADKLS
uniref:Epiplakin 1 n=1 Tax=Petromyzon marinus TaxID=7757 RepID=S4RYD5_PETMA